MLAEAQRIRQLSIDEDIAARSAPPVVQDPGYYDDSDYSDYKFAVIKVLAEYQDPRIIPVMLHFASQAALASESVAEFGEDALPEVLRLATSDEDNASLGIDVLRQVLIRKTLRKPLTADSMRRIARLASDRMRGPQKLDVVGAAIDLAKVTKDPELLKRVKQLTTDRKALQEVGVLDPGEQDMLLEDAADPAPP